MTAACWLRAARRCRRQRAAFSENLCIPLFATVPFILLIWALRKGAPTNLKRTGAIAGLVAGALGAMAYAFHCPDDFLPFLAIWYGGLIALCAFVGSRLGPRLLRW